MSLEFPEPPATFGLGADLPVRRLGFGAMRVTGAGIWGDPPSRQESTNVLRRAVELGVNFIDTADSYGPHVSESLIAEALHPYPDDLTIATKGGLLRDGPNQWRPDGRPEHLRAACEGSLRRLKLERIPLYQFHRPDPKVPFEDSVGTLAALKAEGKIRHVGLSNVNDDELTTALGITPVVSVQNLYGLHNRADDPLVDRCEQEQIAFIPWAPLGQVGGARGRAVKRAARDHGVTTAQVALAWLLYRSPVILPIPGTNSIAHLEENVAAGSIRLTANQVAELGA
jgi:aryl-alcohol dehydrogenase-like predicted oxidoreductase